MSTGANSTKSKQAGTPSAAKAGAKKSRVKDKPVPPGGSAGGTPAPQPASAAKTPSPQSSLAAELIDAWHISNRITLFTLESIPEDALAIAPKKGARSVGAQFAHIHNVRRMWLNVSAPHLSQDMVQFGEPDWNDRSRVIAALKQSADAIAQLLRESFDSGKRVKNFKPTTAAFFSYLIAHEAQHRGLALSLLRHNGRPVGNDVIFKMWEWGKI